LVGATRKWDCRASVSMASGNIFEVLGSPEDSESEEEEELVQGRAGSSPRAIAAGCAEPGEEEEEEICRICRCGEEADRPLYHPCICTGSIKFVHEDCLLEWLQHSSSANGNRNKCELCGHRFGFTPVYEQGAPESLSMHEFIALSLVRAIKTIPFLCRIVVVVVTWGFLIPLATCVMFRILSLGKLNRDGDLLPESQGIEAAAAVSSWSGFYLRLKLSLQGGLYSSWSVGLCASMGIFLSFLTLISVVDFVREHDILTEGVDGDDDGDLRDDDEENEEEVRGEALDVNVAAQFDGGLDEGEEEQEEEEEEQQQQQETEELSNAIGEDYRESNHDINQELDAGPDLDPPPLQPRVPLPAPDLAEEEEEDQPHEEEAAFDIDVDIDDEDDENNMGDLNVALDELLGLRGPAWMLFHNVLWLLTFNGMYLCVALFAPTTVGAVVLSMVSRLHQSITGMQALDAEDESFLLRTLHKVRSQRNFEDHETQILMSGQIWSPESIGLPDPREAEAVCTLDARRRENRDAFFEEVHFLLLELLAVLVGYITTAYMLVALYNLCALLRNRSKNRWTWRRYNRIARVLSLMTRSLKVIIVVFLKMGIFPVLLGVLLEVAGRELVDLGNLDRFLFATQHPVFTLMILWVAGITHMLVITVMVLELRDVLHPDILHGIIRPKDVDDSLLRTVLEEPILRHIRRMAVSCAIYTFLVFAFIYIPAKIVSALFEPNAVLPYAPKLSYTFLEVQLPIELVCIHLGVLNVLDQGKDIIRAAMEGWFTTTCEMLGLKGFLLRIDSETGKVVFGSRETGLRERNYPHLLVFRVLIISGLAWITSLVVTFIALAAPLYVGRFTVQKLQAPILHEPIVYGIGCMVLWRLFAAIGVLRFHQAVLRRVWDRIMRGREDAWSVFQNYLRWIETGCLILVVQPWLTGVLVQLFVLLRSEHPDILVSVEESKQDVWQIFKSAGAVFPVLVGIRQNETASTVEESYMLSASPVHDWMVGLVINMALLHLVLLPDVMMHGEVATRFHLQLMETIQELGVSLDCTNLLSKHVYPVLMVQLGSLVLPFIAVVSIDMFSFLFTGTSHCIESGIVTMFRRGGLSILLCALAPLVALEANKTWHKLHDALRDERYLIGKRLHNMERKTYHQI